MDAATAARVVSDYSKQVQDEAFDTFIGAQPLPILVAGVNWTPEVRNARQTIEDIETRIERGAIQGQGFDRAIDDSYQAYLQLAGGIERSGSKPTVDDERAASRLISLIGDLGHLAKDQGEPLSAESQQLVRQSMALQWQRNLPDIYGAGAAGGVLAMRQNQRALAQDYGRTLPTGRSGGKPVGEPEAVLSNAGAEAKRGIARQNEAGKTLAESGYRVEYLQPKNIEGRKNPDLVVEGRTFDVYSPAAGTSAGNVVAVMASKAGYGQADRIVLNLGDSPLSRHELRAAFNAANSSVREVIVIGRDKIIYRLP